MNMDSNKKTTTHTKKWGTDSVPGPWDVLIIGSGISGLACGSLLSQSGKRVLILEQHFQPGGFTHVFRRGRWEWDTGIHYFGTVTPDYPWFVQLMGLCGGRISFQPFGTVTDTLVFPDLSVQVPGTYEEYKQVLGDLFPAERDGISRYLDKIKAVRKGLTLYFGVNLLPKGLTKAVRRSIARSMHEAATVTTDEMMSRYLQDHHLKMLLDAQWGNIGMPRQRCSFLVHASMVGNYLEHGSAYPVGGSKVFAEEMGRTIAENGSAIRLRAEVDTIMTENGRVLGVKMKDGEEIKAQTVVSTVGATQTYSRFLGDTPEAKEELDAISQLPPAYEYLNLFLGFDSDPREFGYGAGNSWIYDTWDVAPDNMEWNLNDLESDPTPKIFFFSSSSLRDPDYIHNGRGYNGELIALPVQGFFERWMHTEWNRRGADYEDIKTQITEKMVAAVDRTYPGIGKTVAHTELATPPTYYTFTRHSGGVPYGIAPVPERYRSLSLRPGTPVKNLYLCGQDLIMPGIPASFGSAMLTCSYILRGNAGQIAYRLGKKAIDG